MASWVRRSIALIVGVVIACPQAPAAAASSRAVSTVVATACAQTALAAPLLTLPRLSRFLSRSGRVRLTLGHVITGLLTAMGFRQNRHLDGQWTRLDRKVRRAAPLRERPSDMPILGFYYGSNKRIALPAPEAYKVIGANGLESQILIDPHLEASDVEPEFLDHLEHRRSPVIYLTATPADQLAAQPPVKAVSLPNEADASRAAYERVDPARRGAIYRTLLLEQILIVSAEMNPWGKSKVDGAAPSVRVIREAIQRTNRILFDAPKPDKAHLKEVSKHLSNLLNRTAQECVNDARTALERRDWEWSALIAARIRSTRMEHPEEMLAVRLPYTLAWYFAPRGSSVRKESSAVAKTSRADATLRPAILAALAIYDQTVNLTMNAIHLRYNRPELRQKPWYKFVDVLLTLAMVPMALASLLYLSPFVVQVALSFQDLPQKARRVLAEEWRALEKNKKTPGSYEPKHTIEDFEQAGLVGFTFIVSALRQLHTGNIGGLEIALNNLIAKYEGTLPEPEHLPWSIWPPAAQTALSALGSPIPERLHRLFADVPAPVRTAA